MCWVNHICIMNVMFLFLFVWFGLVYTFKNVATRKFQTTYVACIILLLDSFEPEDLDLIQHSLSRVLIGCILLPTKVHLVPCGVC